MQVIKTRYLSSTNYKPARIVAECEAKKIIVSWDYSEGIENNYKLACEKLRQILGWNLEYYSPMVGGEFNGDYYWVFIKNSPIAN